MRVRGICLSDVGFFFLVEEGGREESKMKKEIGDVLGFQNTTAAKNAKAMFWRFQSIAKPPSKMIVVIVRGSKTISPWPLALGPWPLALGPCGSHFFSDQNLG